MAESSESRSRSFLFREVPKSILIGTASDRYGGWIGQIYTPGRYEKGITRRSHKVGNKAFTEETLPVESVAEYKDGVGGKPRKSLRRSSSRRSGKSVVHY
jgi:hypothetical protein